MCKITLKRQRDALNRLVVIIFSIVLGHCSFYKQQSRPGGLVSALFLALLVVPPTLASPGSYFAIHSRSELLISLLLLMTYLLSLISSEEMINFGFPNKVKLRC